MDATRIFHNGKIYTVNKKQPWAEAVVLEGNRIAYVGDNETALSMKGPSTVVQDLEGKVMMPGFIDGHIHPLMASAFLSGIQLAECKDEKEILDAVRAYVEAHPDKEFYFTLGWNEIDMHNVKDKIDMRTQLDAICPDKVLLMSCDSGHDAFANSKALEMAGVTVDTKIAGGTIGVIDGKLSGYLSDMAYNYVLKNTVATMEVFTEADYESICKEMQKALHSRGYTYYQDGWTNYFGTQLMDCLKVYDEKVGLSVVISGTYKIDSYDDWKAEVDKAAECMEKYYTEHFTNSTIKLFADGEAVESGSGWLIETYLDGTHGNQVWDTDVMNAIVKAANEKGLSVHVHAQGDAAVEQVVNAFINAEDTAAYGIYNGICHGRNITQETKELMGEHGIYAAININWRVLHSEAEGAYLISNILDEKLAQEGYPIRSLLDEGVVVTSSTDVPSDSGAPTTVSGIIEVAVNDTRGDKVAYQLDPSERVTVEEAMDIMTINGAIQLQIEDERGSIEVGKYADFLLFDKDFTSCEKDKIHEANVVSVYFEGNEVYTA